MTFDPNQERDEKGQWTSTGSEVLYHGMKQSFTGPIELRPGTNSTFLGNESVQRAGVYVTPSRAVAKDFAGAKGDVAEVRLAPGTRLLDFRNGGLSVQAEQNLIKAGMSDRHFLSAGDLWEKLEAPGFAAIAQKAGYHGAVFQEHSPSGILGDSHVIYDPSRIRRIGPAVSRQIKKL